MSQRTHVEPVNSLLFLSDSDGGEAPVPVRGAMILSTPSCISFRCYPEQDGTTEIVLGPMAEVQSANVPAFDGDLETPNRAVIVSTVELETVLDARVPNTRTRVGIWLNHEQRPDKVTIGLG